MKLNRLYRKMIFLFLCLVLLPVSGCTTDSSAEYDPLTFTLLKVGKADAIVGLSGQHAMIIDAGEEDDGEKVVKFLRQNNVRKVDVMIITHFDQDHVGGADTVLEQIEVENVIVPDYEGVHTEYRDFMEAVNSSGVSLTRLREPVTFRFMDAEITVDPPACYEIENTGVDYDNNFSLITTVVHGDNCLVLMGDAEKQRIREWLSQEKAVSCDFLKVPHHGVYNTALEELFTTLKPKYAAICDSSRHPADLQTLELLVQSCPDIYETKNGKITVISDGRELKIRQKVK